MTARSVLVVSVLLSMLVCAPALVVAQGPTSGATPRPTGSPIQPTVAFGANGMDTSFARISTDPRPAYEGPSAPIEARVLLKNSSRVADAHILMFGFNGLSDSVEITMDDVQAHDGRILEVTQDNRTDSVRQPKVWIKPGDAPTNSEIVMRGSVTAHANGQFHVGAIVIAFDKDYKKFVTPRNEYAEVYAFGLLRAADAVDPEDGRPPFEGQGNVPANGLIAALGVLAAVALLRPRP